MSLSILHISDLHFSRDLTTPRAAILKTHNFDALVALSEYWHHDPTDLVFVTGDVSTDGDPASLNNAYRFLTETTTTIHRNTKKSFGLGLDPSRLLVVPGNHDRYGWGLPFMRNIHAFQSQFAQWSQLATRPRSSHVIHRGGLRIRVLTVDSCAGAFVGSIARGKVHREDLQWLHDMRLVDLEQENKIDLRLLLTHHHVALPSSRPYATLTKLSNRRATLAAMLRGDIDIVLFGHEHVHYCSKRPYGELLQKTRAIARMDNDGFRTSKNLVISMCASSSQQKEQLSATRITISRNKDRFAIDNDQITYNGDTFQSTAPRRINLHREGAMPGW